MLFVRDRSKLRFLRILFFCLIVVIALIFIFVDATYYNWSLSGFDQRRLWDWLDLLIIPIVITIFGVWYSRTEKQNEQRIEEQRVQNETLREYFNQISSLLLDYKLAEQQNGAPAQIIARAQTLTVLKSLDERRRNSVVQFLRDAKLVWQFNDESQCIIDLRYADFRGADLQLLQCFGLHFEMAFFKGANLAGSRFRQACLQGANFEDAHLQGALLVKAQLQDAQLQRARLNKAILIEANLAGANLAGANLEGADFTGAVLDGVDLTGANLKGAIIHETQLAVAKSLSRAKLPNGKTNSA